MKQRLSRMALTAFGLGVFVGGIVGVLFWVLTDRPVVAMLFGLVPPIIMLILVKDRFWEPYDPDE